MEWKELMRRAKLNSIEEYLMCGGDCVGEYSKEPYDKQLNDVYHKFSIYLSSHFSDPQAKEEFSEYFYELADTYRIIYFEMGMIAGAKIGYQLKERLEQLE